MSVVVPVSWGELVDKITILEIKAEKLSDSAKRANVIKELTELSQVRDAHLACIGAGVIEGLHKLAMQLREINTTLWRVEDDIRECERQKDFGSVFIDLARAVYVTNDKRAELKREINLLLGSALVEEKSYAAY